MLVCIPANVPVTGPADIRLGSPAEWLADGHITCSIRCLMGDCKRMVDVRLDTLPMDPPWSRIGSRLVCTECGTPATVNITPNWYDRIGRAVPFSREWKI